MRETRYVLIDDVDGSDAEETVYFAVGRQFYEIDLNAEHAKALREDLDKWTAHARKVRDLPVRISKGPRPTGRTSDAATIRAWAATKGISMGPRGRIPATIREQYYAEVGS